MITCKICNKSFENSITWKHLKTHNISTDEYKKQYGRLISEEYRQKRSAQSSGSNNPNYGKSWNNDRRSALSEKLKGKDSWNKGKPLDENTKKLLSDKAKDRNKRWHETDSHPLKGKRLSENTKAKIKAARAEQVIKKESIDRAIETKIKKGYDLAFFRGKKHNQASLDKIRATLSKNLARKKEKSIQKIFENLSIAKVRLINDPSENVLALQCEVCDQKFTFTKQYTMGKKFKPNLCINCFPRAIVSSKTEKDIAIWLESLDIKVIHNDRSIIPPFELDMYLPEYDLAIEYNGLYWHSELNGKDSNYHVHKNKLCNEQGIALITIFEDEWLNHEVIVKSRLRNLVNKTEKRIFARKCQIIQISSQSANEFLNQNHIQGAGRSNARYGAIYENRLVAVMTFSKSNLSRKISGWEIDRFCSVLDTSIPGIASKIFKQFVKDQNPEDVISFADKRWSNDGFYTKLGFVLEKETKPNYWYFRPNECKRYHRFSLRKNKDDDQSLTEWENRQSQGWDRIWDCGNLKYVWKNK